MTPEQITAFVAVIQLGTLAAVIVYFMRDIYVHHDGIFAGEPALVGVFATPLPARPRAGLADHHRLDTDRDGRIARKKDHRRRLDEEPDGDWREPDRVGRHAVSGEQFGKRRNEIEHIGIREALIIGVAQVFSLIPGSSRSGTTITGALFAGMSREAAARFSFLLSIPAIGASGLLEFKKPSIFCRE